jgi:hypothetical protein
MKPDDRVIDVSNLLTIDVESELRKLTQAQLQGPWQLPAELIRRALRGGATLVDLQIQRTRITAEDDGLGVSRATLEHLAALLDPQRDQADRHAALAELERVGALSLLAIAGLGASSLEIVTPGQTPEEPGWTLRWRSGAAQPEQGWVRRYTAPGPEKTRVEVRGAKLDRSRARRWVEHVARFTRAAIMLDGRDVATGFEDSLSVNELREPLSGRISIPREGEVARLWLLLDGVLTAHLTIPDAPCFEAVVETRRLAPSGSTAANLRDVIAPHVDLILEQCIEHLIALGERGPGLPVATRTRVSQLLLQAARRRVHAGTIARLPLFHGVEMDGAQRFFDLLSLRQSVVEEAGERVLSALFPDQDPEVFTSQGRIFILDERERSLLGELLDLQFRPPQRRELRSSTWRRFGQALRSGLAFRGADLRFALGEIFGGRRVELSESEMTEAERTCIAALRLHAEEREICLCEGTGPVRSSARRLVLPRGSTAVEACVQVVSRDPSWAYPALLALLDGRDYPKRARRNWTVTAWSR